jgi:integrase
MENKLKFTKKSVESLPFEPDKQKLYWDTELKGFGLLVSRTTKTYIVQRTSGGKSIRTTIGSHKIYVPETARPKAIEHLAKIAEGKNPNQLKKDQKTKKITLDQIVKKYLAERQHQLKPRTIRNYEDYIKNHLSDWCNKALADLTPDMIIKRHNDIQQSKKYAAMHTFKFLETLFRYAQNDDEDLKNPVLILRKKRLYIQRERRDSTIKDHQLEVWYKSVCNLKNDSMRDALIFLLFTGLRKNEAFKLKWEYIDMKDKSLRIPHTKSGKPFNIPLSDFLIDLLVKRKNNKSIWVFDGNGQDGHITESRKAIERIEKETGIKFMLHDLRRTYITIAERTAPTQYSLKKLLNHSTAGDVTAGYIVTDMQRLREIVEKITVEIKTLIKVD